jgi:hypothetical protein
MRANLFTNGLARFFRGTFVKASQNSPLFRLYDSLFFIFYLRFRGKWISQSLNTIHIQIKYSLLLNSSSKQYSARYSQAEISFKMYLRKSRYNYEKGKQTAH